jgi:tetratricopeptide (TPR) repeat protein
MKNLLRRCVHAVFGPPTKKDPNSPSARWDRVSEAAKNLMLTDPSAAEAPAREALEIAEKFIGNWRIFESLEMLVKLMCSMHKAREAEELCDRLVEFAKHCYGEDNGNTIDLFSRLFYYFLNSGNLEKADKLFREAIPTLKKHWGRNNWELAGMVFWFARLSNTLGRRKAEQWALRALIKHARRMNCKQTEYRMEVLLATSFAEEGNFGMAEELARTLPDWVKPPCDNEDYEMALEIPRLAEVCFQSGRYNEAEDLFDLNVWIVETFSKNEYCSDLIPGFNGLARLYFKTERQSEAENLLRISHSIIVKAFLSEDTGNYLLSQDGLLVFLDSQGKTDESEALLVDLKGKCEERFGRKSEKTYIVLYQLGALYLNHGKLDEAEACYSEAFDTANELCDPGSPDIIYMLNELGVTKLKKAQYREADRYLLKAVERYDSSGIEEGPLLAEILGHLGNAAYEVGNYSKAELYCSRQIAILEKQQPPDQPALILALSGLGWTLHLMERYTEAEEIYRSMMGLLHEDKSDTVQKGWTIATTLKRHSDVLVALERYSEAEGGYSRALDIFKRLEDEESAWVAGCLEGFARIRVESGSVGEGRVYLEQAIRIYEKTGVIKKEHLSYLKELLVRLSVHSSGTIAGPGEGSDDDSEKSIN